MDEMTIITRKIGYWAITDLLKFTDQSTGMLFGMFDGARGKHNTSLKEMIRAVLSVVDADEDRTLYEPEDCACLSTDPDKTPNIYNVINCRYSLESYMIENMATTILSNENAFRASRNKLLRLHDADNETMWKYSSIVNWDTAPSNMAEISDYHTLVKITAALSYAMQTPGLPESEKCLNTLDRDCKFIWEGFKGHISKLKAGKGDVLHTDFSTFTGTASFNSFLLYLYTRKKELQKVLDDEFYSIQLLMVLKDIYFRISFEVVSARLHGTTPSPALVAYAMLNGAMVSYEAGDRSDEIYRKTDDGPFSVFDEIADIFHTNGFDLYTFLEKSPLTLENLQNAQYARYYSAVMSPHLDVGTKSKSVDGIEGILPSNEELLPLVVIDMLCSQMHKLHQEAVHLAAGTALDIADEIGKAVSGQKDGLHDPLSHEMEELRDEMIEAATKHAQKMVDERESVFEGRESKLKGRIESLERQLAAAKAEAEQAVADRDSYAEQAMRVRGPHDAEDLEAQDKEYGNESGNAELKTLSSREMDILQKYVRENKVVLVGGHPDWLARIRTLLPGIITYRAKETNSKRDAATGADILVLNTHTCSHSDFARLKQAAKKEGTPLVLLPYGYSPQVLLRALLTQVTTASQ